MTEITQDIPEERLMQVKRQVQSQIIECLNRFYAMETGMWGKPVECLIIRTVIQGRLQGKLYDLSSLAAALDLPISTIHRKITKLIDDGYLISEPSGKSVYLAPTEKTSLSLDHSFEDMVTTLRRLYNNSDTMGYKGDRYTNRFSVETEPYYTKRHTVCGVES